ncbi:hypothetical protein AALP_AA5G159200 [Arabis alpina]|uniref:Uncharacterized protein n=1 Tax=Arabis alpina TaxID=50452 RepID=A0A087GXD6_ARAAL|nr:hypothetical protein AALP_AA5G159200 [Arabis alpina]
MGDGKIHFRFQTEEDLEAVMAHRQYHFDGSMIALERWIPTVRRDFPNTILFWIVVYGLPDYRRDEASVRSIGEALGEWLDVDVTEPTPRVCVMLDSGAPLVLRRESDDDGVIVRLRFKYKKLQKHCNQCLRITHKAPSCPERAHDGPPLHREPRRDPNRKRDTDTGKGRPWNNREDRGKAVAPRVSRVTSGKGEAAAVLPSRPKPVRRDIMAELDSCQATVEAPATAHSSTKEWVRKTFVTTDHRRSTSPSQTDHTNQDRLPEANPVKARAPWYRTTEEEAAIANSVSYQAEKWDAVETPPVPVLQPVIPALVGDGYPQADRVLSRDAVVSPKETGLFHGPEIEEAQQMDDNVELVAHDSDSQVMGLQSFLSPTGIIFPLKGLVDKANKDRKLTQRVTKALGVKKKIEHSAFHGNRVHKHMALAALEAPKALVGVSNPSPSKTGPGEGETSKEFNEPVVKEKLPADA